MRHLRNQDDYWKPCRPGTIFQATDSKFRRQRRKFAVQMAMGGAVATAGIFSGIFVLLQEKRVPRVTALAETEPQPMDSIRSIKLTCNDISQLAPMYVNAVGRDVEKRTEDQKLLIADFDQHLHVCQNCSAMIFKAINEA